MSARVGSSQFQTSNTAFQPSRSGSLAWVNPLALRMF